MDKKQEIVNWVLSLRSYAWDVNGPAHSIDCVFGGIKITIICFSGHPVLYVDNVRIGGGKQIDEYYQSIVSQKNTKTYIEQINDIHQKLCGNGK